LRIFRISKNNIISAKDVEVLFICSATSLVVVTNRIPLIFGFFFKKRMDGNAALWNPFFPKKKKKKSRRNHLATNQRRVEDGVRSIH
jgi:hypothetical protein